MRVVKVVPLTDPDAVASFVFEMATHNRLKDHPCVLSLLRWNLGTRVGELCTPRFGCTLFQEMSASNGVAAYHRAHWSAIRAELIVILQALQHEHVVHRDLHPNNLAVERREEGGMRLMVFDFGHACGLTHGGWPWGPWASYPQEYDAVYFITHYERACRELGAPVVLSAFELFVPRERVDQIARDFHLN